jgi:hypothetical protein
MDIGQTVRVRRLRDRTSQDVISLLGKTGTVERYKVVDGKGIGMVVKFENNFATWFFEDELEPTG